MAHSDAPTPLTREQVIAHRVAAHGLLRSAAAPAELAVLDLGVQDSPPGALRAALSARLAEPLGPDADLTAGGDLTLVWSHRGAPHLHRSAGLTALSAACWPRDDADAAARLSWQRARLAAVGGAARSAYRTVAEAVRDVLDRPLTKGALSSAVTEAVPAELSPYCRPCGTHHVGEQLLRLAALAGGARLCAGAKPLLIEPLPGWAGPPADEDAGTAEVQTAYLRFLAPATESDVAGYLGTTRAAAAPDRPDDLVAVSVDGRAGAVPAASLGAMLAAEPADIVRLLPPSDPLLQGRDREVLVPEPAHRKAIWTSIGAPGVVLAGADVVGVWRPSKRGRVLDVTVTEFRPLTRGEQQAVAVEAQRLAVVRGASDAAVTVAAAGGEVGVGRG